MLSTTDTFGSLLDWGVVLERLQALRTQGRLDEHQAGLCRILRYRDNWRLRETAMELSAEVRKPEAELLETVTGIMNNDEEYYDLRILAVDALGHLAPRVPHSAGAAITHARETALRRMRELSDTPQPPILHTALMSALATISASR